MMREKDGISGHALKTINAFTVDDVRDFIGIGDAGEPIAGQIPFTGSAKKLLERSIREALALAHSYIGSEHLLLALTECPGECDEFLNRKLGSTWEEIIRLEVCELLRGPDGKMATPVPIHEKKAKKNPLDLEEESLLQDVMTGFRMWRDDKLNNQGLDDRDEAFVRWVEGSRASKFV